MGWACVFSTIGGPKIPCEHAGCEAEACVEVSSLEDPGQKLQFFCTAHWPRKKENPSFGVTLAKASPEEVLLTLVNEVAALRHAVKEYYDSLKAESRWLQSDALVARFPWLQVP